jgi:hypothetical protein
MFCPYGAKLPHTLNDLPTYCPYGTNSQVFIFPGNMLTDKLQYIRKVLSLRSKITTYAK